jgi:transposase
MFAPDVRIFVAAAPVDLRISFDRLAGIVRTSFRDDPRSGSLFVFLNKAKDRCKVLFYDRTGYCVLYKRLDVGTFHLAERNEKNEPVVAIAAEALARFLEGNGAQTRKPRERPPIH